MTVPLRNVTTDALTDAPVDGLFVAIGHQPNTALVKGQHPGHDPDLGAERLRGR